MKTFKFLLIFIAFTICSCSSDDPSSNEMSETEVIITPNVGVGSIMFEDDGNKIMDEFGSSPRLTSVSGGGETAFVMWYDDEGMGFQLDYIDTKGLSLQEIVAMSSDLIDLDQNILTIIMMSPSNAKTKEGISLGSRREEVVAAYGEPNNVLSSSEEYDDLNMFFTYNTSGIVNRMDLKR